jgi:hypothetical protein
MRVNQCQVQAAAEVYFWGGFQGQEWSEGPIGLGSKAQMFGLFVHSGLRFCHHLRRHIAKQQETHSSWHYWQLATSQGHLTPVVYEVCHTRWKGTREALSI